MAAHSMSEYLSIIAADYAVTLDNPLQIVITEKGKKNQFVNLGDDGSEERISLSDDSIFYVDIQWPRKSESSIGDIVDWFHDTAKANGRNRTFQWAHPTDTHIYVARFNCDLDRTISRGLIHGVPNCQFKILGYIS